MNTERLLKLAEHLKTGKLGHKKFDFATFNGGDGCEVGCGTSGCAIGECPFVFPEHWEFKPEMGLWAHWWPMLTNSEHPTRPSDTFKDAQKFFGIDEKDCNFLFLPAEDEEEAKQTGQLREDATQHEVAARIEMYVTQHNPTPNDTRTK